MPSSYVAFIALFLVWLHALYFHKRQVDEIESRLISDVELRQFLRQAKKVLALSTIVLLAALIPPFVWDMGWWLVGYLLIVCVSNRILIQREEHIAYRALFREMASD
ncbi:MAG TPA: hypothetical protein VFQ72_03575 [Candidatus Paceibacterota bacterium]|nr:hypothetical protein [Candidatus Paceibacterota bacterium]